MYEREILDLFQSIVVHDSEPTSVFVRPSHMYAVNSQPNPEQIAALDEYFKPLDLRTLFSVEERMTGSLEQLLTKQILDYISTYALNTPGIFNLDVTSGTVVTVNFVDSITVSALNEKLQKLLYANAPVKDATVIVKLIRHFRTIYDINAVANNELRVLLFDHERDIFTNGDDAVRFICYDATSSALLIKSKEVIDAVKAGSRNVDRLTFLQNHKMVLAQVFNRHKPLILALKNENTRTIINEIGRLSKTKHVPIKESFAKNYISTALKGEADIDPYFLDKTTLRDRFKFLNILNYKLLKNTDEVYVIRNGKTHLEEGRRVYSNDHIYAVQADVIDSLQRTLEQKLGEANILLDPNVDYGLPISRKQALGRLPFGTRVTVTGEEIASGIYWENAWGSTDLDLSAIDYDGNRTGWGQYSGYSRSNPIVYSGDVTYAPSGAMEFMTSKRSYADDYGLLVNSYSGSSDSGMELVVGSKSKDQWITDPVIREKHQLPGRGAVLGFIKNGAFIVYSPAVSANHVSSPKNAKIIQRGMASFWTVRSLLDELGIRYDLNRVEGKEYDFDLTYSNFSLDKLEEMF